MTVASKSVEHLVFTRDEGCCAHCGTAITGDRGRDWSVHHRRPRGSGGSSLEWVNRAANLVLLCGSGTTGCHGWVESHRDDARDAGFLVRLNGVEIAAHVPIIHAIHGRVLLDDDGSVHAGIEVF